jgi:hypothetical protein
MLWNAIRSQSANIEFKEKVRAKTAFLTAL